MILKVVKQRGQRCNFKNEGTNTYLSKIEKLKMHSSPLKNAFNSKIEIVIFVKKIQQGVSAW